MEAVPLIRLASLGTFPLWGEGFGPAVFSTPCGEKKWKEVRRRIHFAGGHHCLLRHRRAATRAGAGEGGIAVIVPPIGRRGDRVSRVEPAGGRFDGNQALATLISEDKVPP